MENKEYIRLLIEVVEWEKSDVVTASVVGEEDSGDNVYEYGDIFG